MMEEPCEECSEQNRGRPALTRAAENQHEQCLKAILKSGADVDEVGLTRDTPLISASWKGNNNCLRLLIEAGADLNKTGIVGYTALIFAAFGGHEQCVKELIQAGADVDKVCTSEQHTALMKASIHGNYQCVNVLLQSGADVNYTTRFNRTALSETVLKGVKNRWKCIELLVEAGADVTKANVNAEDYHGFTPIMKAAKDGDVNLMKFLIEAGAAVNLITYEPDDPAWFRNTELTYCYLDSIIAPIIIATMKDHCDCVELLIQAGADVNVVENNEKGHSALMHAAEKGFHNCIELLVKAGAEINRALRNAVSHGHLDIVKLLLNQDKDNTVRMKATNEALHALVKRFNEECFRLLLQAGADVNRRDNFGYTALTSAAVWENLQCIKALLLSGAFINKSVDEANALEMHITTSNTVNKSLAMLLYAAGEEFTGSIVLPIPEFLQHNDIKMQLKHMTRQAIRKHLINLDLHAHLFDRIPQLPLPSALKSYLLYNMSLESDDNNDNDDDDDDDDH